MIKNIFLFFFLGCFYLLTGQNIITVDNSSGSMADFTTIQEAIDASEPNDFIYVAGTGIIYPDFIINKRVNILGPGYLLAENYPNVNNPVPARVWSVDIVSGGDNSMISGMWINNMLVEDVSNVIISKNYFYEGNTGITPVDATNINIFNNYFDKARGIQAKWACAGLNIHNNVFTGTTTNFYVVEIDPQQQGSCGAIVQNNIFLGLTEFYNCSVQNNIFLGPNPQEVNSTISYNVLTESAISGNLLVSDESSIFVGYPTQGILSSDGRFELASNSPAIGAGEGGVDCGIFSGSDPYVLSGIPSLPFIYYLDAPATAPVGDSIHVTIKVNTNQ